MLSPERFHDAHHNRHVPFESCWYCQRARSRCRSKIVFHSWQEAEEWVQDKNESDGYAKPVSRYVCRWCERWHMFTPKGGIAAARVERARRKWLIARRAGQ